MILKTPRKSQSPGEEPGPNSPCKSGGGGHTQVQRAMMTERLFAAGAMTSPRRRTARLLFVKAAIEGVLMLIVLALVFGLVAYAVMVPE